MMDNQSIGKHTYYIHPFIHYAYMADIFIKLEGFSPIILWQHLFGQYLYVPSTILSIILYLAYKGTIYKF